MTTPANPDDLLTWLRAQLDEDERVARATTALSSGTWRIDARGEVRDSDGVGVIHASARIASADLDHIARHDPARVLAEVDAKRRILDWLDRRDDWATDNNLWTWDSSDARALLALPYADRPGYREEWRPA